MKKILTLIAAASVMFACSKDVAPEINPGNGETGSVSFALNAPNYVVKNNGIRNAAAPASFAGLTDIRALIFHAGTGVRTINADITANIGWTDDAGTWTGAAIAVPTGAQKSLVVFNSAGMYDSGTATKLADVRFHLSGTATVTEIANGTPTVNEIATSESIQSQTIVSRGTYTLGGNVKRVNSKLRVNIAYNQTGMFATMGTATANIKVKSVQFDSIPESVDFDGANASGKVSIARNDYNNLLLSSDKASNGVVSKTTDNVFETLAFPFAASKVTLKVVCEYTTDGSSYQTLTLRSIPVSAVGRNQILNVNIWIANLTGDVEYGFTFVDWTTATDQATDGVEDAE